MITLFWTQFLRSIKLHKSQFAKFVGTFQTTIDIRSMQDWLRNNMLQNQPFEKVYQSPLNKSTPLVIYNNRFWILFDCVKEIFRNCFKIKENLPII